MMKITANEFKVLDCIAMNCYQPTNYRAPKVFEHTDAIWTAEILETGSKFAKDLKKSSLSGIVSSLSQKGLVHCSSHKPDRENPATISLTEAGFNVWQRGCEVEEFLAGN